MRQNDKKGTEKSYYCAIMCTNDWWWWCFVSCKLATYSLGSIVFFVRVCATSFFVIAKSYDSWKWDTTYHQFKRFISQFRCIGKTKRLISVRAEHTFCLSHVIFGFVFIFSVMIQFLCASAWVSILFPFAPVLTSILFYWTPNGLLRFNHVSICRCVMCMCIVHVCEVRRLCREII